MGQRSKNEHFVCPIIYGSKAVPITAKDPPASDPSHTHRWTIFLRGANGEDLTPIIRRVSFKLHESFVPPTRVVESPPFEVTETGWGEFEILIKLSFTDSQEKPLQLFHQLQLYAKDDPQDPNMPISKETILAENYDEIIFNDPFEDFVEPLRKFRTVNQNIKKRDHPRFNAQLEAEEVKRLYEINEKRVMPDIEKFKNKLAKLEQEKRKLESEIRALESEIMG